MADISNKTLALLVGVALVVSLIGLVSGPNLITGRATDIGTADLDVEGVTVIDVLTAENNIDFFSGSIQGTGPCNLDSNAVAMGGDCSGGWLSSAYDAITVNNSGSVNLTVDVSSDKSEDDFVTGTDPEMLFQTSDGNCSTGAITSNGGRFAANDTDYDACDDLAPGEQFNLTMKVVIPFDADTGARTATLTFTGLQS